MVLLDLARSKAVAAAADMMKDKQNVLDETLASMLKGVDANTVVLDIGAGYGGAARHLAKTYGCKVICVNISETQNKLNRELNKKAGLEDKVEVLYGDFEAIPADDNSIDVVWSQDAMVHSGNREEVLAQVDRVLKEDGDFIFTDLMQTYDCPKSILKPVLDRIHLDSLGSFGFYVEQARKLEINKTEVVDLSEHLTIHYQRVMEETQERYDEMVTICGREYIDKMIQGLKHWVNAGKNDHLSWGIVHMDKNKVF